MPAKDSALRSPKPEGTFVGNGSSADEKANVVACLLSPLALALRDAQDPGCYLSI